MDEPPTLERTEPRSHFTPNPPEADETDCLVAQRPHPLVRGFGLIVFEKWPSLYAFWQEQFQDDFTYSVVSRNFQQLNGCWGDFPWTTVSRYLNAVGLGVSDPRREFLQQLFERKDEITVSLNANNHPASLNVIRQVLKRWRSALRATDRDPRSVEYKLGLTTEERGSNL